MLLKFRADLHQLIEYRLIPLSHLSNWRRGTNAGNNILALGVDEKFAIELVLAGRGVACKRHACAGIFAHIAKHHRLHIDGGAIETSDLIDLPVGNRLARRP